MHTIRKATVEDAARISAQRHSMFADNDFGSPRDHSAMDRAFEPWVRERLEDGRYLGLFVEEDNEVVAGAGIFFADFPPHYLDSAACRPYLLNFYTADAARGRGYAKMLLRAADDECRCRGHRAIVLHASPFGRPLYEAFGFEQTNELMLKL